MIALRFSPSLGVEQDLRSERNSRGRALGVESIQARLAVNNLTVRASESSRTSLLIASYALVLGLALMARPEMGVKAASTFLSSGDSPVGLPDLLLYILLVFGQRLLHSLLGSFLFLLLLLASCLLSLFLGPLRLPFSTALLA